MKSEKYPGKAVKAELEVTTKVKMKVRQVCFIKCCMFFVHSNGQNSTIFGTTQIVIESQIPM